MPAAISVQNVVRHYELGESIVPAVDGISIDIAEGEFTALLGTSGSGKSTLMNLIAGLDRPTSGGIITLGRDLARMTSEELARYRRFTVGMVFQSFNLIPTMRVDENVELPLRFAEVAREEREARVGVALDRVGLLKRRAHRPSEISGGEQQRTALARALVNQPSILLADEPTGNLDSRTGLEIMSLIQELNQTMGMTVLMVTHERILANRYAHRQFHLGDGKLLDTISSGGSLTAGGESGFAVPESGTAGVRQ